MGIDERGPATGDGECHLIDGSEVIDEIAHRPLVHIGEPTAPQPATATVRHRQNIDTFDDQSAASGAVE